MDSTNTGGPAFARPYSHDNFNDETELAQHGMTLRDYFAARAMQAHIGRDDVWDAIAQEKITPEKLCSGCYMWADAMLKARAA